MAKTELYGLIELGREYKPTEISCMSMQTSGLFTTHQIRIPIQFGKPLKLIIFGDVHRDSPNHAHSTWQRDLKYFKTQKDAIFLGMGDYLDSASTSERDALSVARLHFHESTADDLEKLARKKVDLLSKEMDFMQGRLLGLMNGNHFFEFQDGTNSDQALCTKLGCKYLGVSSFLRLCLTTSGKTRSTIDIWAHHGTGGSRLIGSSLNRVDQMREHAEADIYIMGHDHKRAAVPAQPRLYLSPCANGEMKIKQRQAYLVRSGSYLASYVPNEKNYNVDAGRGPSSLGHVELLLTTTNPSNENERTIQTEIKAVV